MGADSEVKNLVYERRVLILVTATTALGVVAWLMALSTDYWVVVVADNPQLTSDSSPDMFLWSYSGLWKKCIVSASREDINSTTVSCHYHTSSGDLDASAVTSVCVLVLILTFISAGFAIYSLRHPRYTYRRIAGASLFITASILLVLIQFVQSELDLAQDTVQVSGSPETNNVVQHFTVLYGYSYLVAWCVLLIFLCAGFSFCAFSRKKKMLPFDNDQFIN